MMEMLSIAREYSDVPAGRYVTDGPNSGERFREEFLLPRLRKIADDDKLVVLLDGAEGYGSSFLEEAFGGLVRKRYFSLDQLKARLEIKAQTKPYEIYMREAWRYMENARPQ